jgi:hypothetical protein
MGTNGNMMEDSGWTVGFELARWQIAKVLMKSFRSELHE